MYFESENILGDFRIFLFDTLTWIHVTNSVSVAHKGQSKQDNYSIELCTLLKYETQTQDQKT